MKVGSFRWWFESRETGQITIAQFPDWPLFAIGAGYLVRAIADDGSTLVDLAGAAIIGLWVFWGADEMVLWVNPWRRVLGTVVIAWQLIRLVS